MYAGQEATVRTRPGTTVQNWEGRTSKLYLPSSLFNLYAEYILWNACWMKHKLESRLQGEMSITSDMQMITTFMAESEEELKNFLMKEKEESQKADLKLNIKKTKIMASSPITLWQIDGETMETVTNLIFLGSKITADGNCSHEIKRCLLFGRKAMINLDSILKRLCQQRSIGSNQWFFQ